MRVFVTSIFSHVIVSKLIFYILLFPTLLLGLSYWLEFIKLIGADETVLSQYPFGNTQGPAYCSSQTYISFVMLWSYLCLVAILSSCAFAYLKQYLLGDIMFLSLLCVYAYFWTTQGHF